MSEGTILSIILGIYIFNFLLDKILSFLNINNYSENLPPLLNDIYDEEGFQRSKSYHKTNYNLNFWLSIISFGIMLILLGAGIFGKLDDYLRTYFENDLWKAIAFFAILGAISEVFSLPIQWYKTFVIEEKFGFNKTTPRTFILDKIKGYFLALILGGSLGFAFLWLVLELGNNFWWYFWIIITTFSLLMNTFFATLILPLFNKLTPLEDGELRLAIENYCKEVSFPLKNIFVIDGSKRSNKSNAFFSGFGKYKKVVFYDTLIEQHSTEELVAVLAHEVGHYKKRHILLNLVLSVLQTGMVLFILSLFVFNPLLSKSLGGSNLSIHLNLMAFGFLFSPISTIIGLLGSVLSRKHEYEADHFAATTYQASPLAEALKKLSSNNLSNLTPHPAYVFFYYSHPPLLQRLQALDYEKS